MKYAFGIAILCVPFSKSYGQYGNPGQQGQQGRPGNISTVQIKGELQDSNGKVLQVKKEDGTSIYVMMPQEIRNVEFRADVTEKQLMPGMLARLRVDYESLSKGTASAKSVDLFPPSEVSIVKPRSPQERAEYVPGLYPVAQISNDPNSKEVQIVGEVVGAKDGNLILNTGEAVQIKINDETQMRFRTSSLDYVKQGNKVEGNGISTDPQGMQVTGTRIAIIGELPEQAAAEEGKPATKEKSKSKRKTRRESKAETKAKKDAAAEATPSEESKK